jgi:hypothetical protein
MILHLRQGGTVMPFKINHEVSEKNVMHFFLLFKVQIKKDTTSNYMEVVSFKMIQLFSF